MAKSSSSNDAVDPAHHGPGGADAPSGSLGNVNLGSVGAVSRGRKSRRVVPLRDHLDALYRDTIAVSEAARRWFDGPAVARGIAAWAAVGRIDGGAGRHHKIVGRDELVAAA
jgi:hypothetical protein